MDEHRVGLKPIVGRVRAERGKAPTVPVQHRYQWLYLYAFACPQTGEGQYWLLPSVNTEAFQAVLERFAAAERAKAQGWQSVRTGNHTVNREMLGINAEMGFVRGPARVVLNWEWEA